MKLAHDLMSEQIEEKMFINLTPFEQLSVSELFRVFVNIFTTYMNIIKKFTEILLQLYPI